MPNPNGIMTDDEAWATPAPNGEMTDAEAFSAPSAAHAPIKSFAASKTGRALHGAMDPIYGIDQAVPHAISYVASLGGNFPNSVSNFYAGDAAKMDSAVNQREGEYSAAKDAAGFKGIDWMRVLGNIASPANVLVGGAAAKVPEATTALGRALQGIGVGAAYGATAPTETSPGESFGEAKAKQVATSAVLGAAAPLAGETVARVVSPNTSENVQKLLGEKIRLTPGQILGGTPQSIEDALTSVPMLGDAIKSARFRGIEDMNKATANRALEPIGQNLPNTVNAGHEMITYVHGKLSDAYNAIIPKLTGQADGQFNSEIANLRGMAQNMPSPQEKQFNNILDTQVMKKIGQNGIISGEGLKEMESSLGAHAKGYMGDSNFDQRNLGNALSEVQKSIREMMMRSNPDHAPELQKINEGYANYARLRAAAASTGAGKHEGVFTPAQLAAAVRNADKSVGKGQFAKGDALMQDLSGAANGVIPSTVPDSGSIGRALTGAAVLGHFSPAAVAGAAAGSSLYTQPGMALMEALLAKRPNAAAPIAKAVRKITSPVGLSQALLRSAQSGNQYSP